MANMNIFEGDAFGLISLSGAIDRVDYAPGFLGSLGLFSPDPVSNSTVWIDERDGEIQLVPTSPSGAPPEELVKDDRKARPFRVPRIAKGATLYAREIASIRAFGSENEQERVQTEYMRRLARVRQDVEVTHEHMRLGALQGILLDADGSTVIYNYFTEFGITPAADVSFDLDDDDADVAGIARQLARSMARSSRGAIGMGATIHALAGDEFYDALINHPQVRETYLNWSAAADLRDQAAFGAFTYGGVTWHNYRGTDDNSTVAIDVDEAKFFPMNAPGVFSHIMAPADEFMPFVGAPGQSVYAMNILDRDRQAWTRGEVYSYPLMICKRPEVLRTGTLN
jgi:hypothetical protein